MQSVFVNNEEYRTSNPLQTGLANFGHRPSLGCCLFVNKVLLKHSHASSFEYCLWLLHTLTSELRSCDRDHMADRD